MRFGFHVSQTINFSISAKMLANKLNSAFIFGLSYPIIVIEGIALHCSILSFDKVCASLLLYSSHFTSVSFSLLPALSRQN